jgi:hypothetical protein
LINGLQARYTFLEAFDESQHLLFAYCEGRAAGERDKRIVACARLRLIL